MELRITFLKKLLSRQLQGWRIPPISPSCRRGCLKPGQFPIGWVKNITTRTENEISSARSRNSNKGGMHEHTDCGAPESGCHWTICVKSPPYDGTLLALASAGCLRIRPPGYLWMVFWDVKPWNLVDSCQRFGGDCYLHLEGISVV